MQRYSETWNLENVFPGGSSSEELTQAILKVESEIVVALQIFESAPPITKFEDIERLHSYVTIVEELYNQFSNIGPFFSCLQAQNTKDTQAIQLSSSFSKNYAELTKIQTALQQLLSPIEQTLWEEFMSTPELKEISFVLSEMRDKAKDLLSYNEESLMAMLSVDGFHSWGEMYDTVVGSITIEHDGESLSVGQAFNLLSHQDAAVRKEVYEKWSKAWTGNQEHFARILNSLAGYRLAVYKLRGWELMKEPLSVNRMQEKTLDAMWEAAEESRPALQKFLKRKAERMGLEKLAWHDLNAPVGDIDEKMPYEEGVDFIVTQFKKYGEKLASFTERAVSERWIEVEDRPGKRPGGFCTDFSNPKESRIFMTYSGTMDNVSTLAHELGHAFHNEAVAELHSFNTHYSMNVAETASTFAEAVVIDGAIEEASSKERKIALLETKLQSSVAYFMNIHARYLFERRFYEERSKGYVSAERLTELMKGALVETHGDSLATYEDFFWASKLHFYITGVPFYNFPYTFGYMFSQGIYALAKKEGPTFEEKYIGLLRDTARMNVEELAQTHLNVDVTEKDFWLNAVRLLEADVEEYLALTAN
ncbi:MAG: M3 family oligoendopeptidase [Bacilli bacterium]